MGEGPDRDETYAVRMIFAGDVEGEHLGGRSDTVVRIPLEKGRSEQEQPMGSLFEQALLIFLDSVVLRLMTLLERTSEDMERIHSNLP